MKLHPDWPEFEHQKYRWDYPDPVGDLAYALDAAAGPVVPLATVSTVERYSIESTAGTWSAPGDEVGTELSLVVLGTLIDGRWFALEAWNDYTGWGCQDGADVYVGATQEDAIAQGLTNSGRRALGLPEVTA